MHNLSLGNFFFISLASERRLSLSNSSSHSKTHCSDLTSSAQSRSLHFLGRHSGHDSPWLNSVLGKNKLKELQARILQRYLTIIPPKRSSSQPVTAGGNQIMRHPQCIKTTNAGTSVDFRNDCPEGQARAPREEGPTGAGHTCQQEVGAQVTSAHNTAVGCPSVSPVQPVVKSSC